MNPVQMRTEVLRPVVPSRTAPAQSGGPAPGGLSVDSFRPSSQGGSVAVPLTVALVGGGVAAAMGAAAAAAHPVVGGIVGAVAGIPLGAILLGPLGNGKGAEGLVYPLLGAVGGAAAGAVAGATAGPAAPWIFGAAGALAGYSLLR